jgi:hypothetical protein
LHDACLSQSDSPPGSLQEPVLQSVPFSTFGSLKVGQRPVVVDDHVCFRGAFRIGKLRVDASASGSLVEAVARGEALDGRWFFHNDNPDLVDQVFPAGFEQHGGFEDGDAGARHLEVGEFFAGEFTDAGPNDVGEALQFVGPAEHLAAEGAAVDSAVLRYDILAEGFDDCAVRIGAGFVSAVTEQVRIDDGDFAVTKKPGNRGLSTGDAAGEANDVQTESPAVRWSND